ncbi:tyrosine-protein phosphatase [Sansalvadorimonas verongulae]|uniref:tyrosine-protein phosphatase n=1 Tax=Sansalvadorimonas verongulae TaxID=2172824 RepID=UPI0012BCBC89|nr:CpsB/CapC family capsule biosynthesis tyrosine phosphatase [Sansalvadorimonas verongulae]MTI12910.1 capsular biosynthesis protein [Sansalvadorimonas verongulae]
MIDIHNHIIPGIDDGAQTIEDSLALLQLATDNGITHLVCTPHMHPGRFNNTTDTIKPAFETLQQAAREHNLPIQLAMAAEVRISDEFMIQLKRDKVPFLGRWEDKTVVLLEMPHDRIPMGIENLLSWLDRQNIRALIAHPERNKEMMRKPELAHSLAKRGALFQLTAASVAGGFGQKALQTAQWFLENELAFCVASDAHNVTHRPPAMKAAYEALGAELGELLCVTNPLLLTRDLFKAV